MEQYQYDHIHLNIAYLNNNIFKVGPTINMINV